MQKFALITIFAFFFHKILITLLVLKPPSWNNGSFRWKDRWLLPLFSFFHVSCLSLKVQLLRSRWRRRLPASYIGMTVFQRQYIYISGPIFVKLSNKFNPRCDFCEETEHMKLKRPSIKLVYCWLHQLKHS